jgi:hypothetical protein
LGISAWDKEGSCALRSGEAGKGKCDRDGVHDGDWCRSKELGSQRVFEMKVSTFKKGISKSTARSECKNERQLYNYYRNSEVNKKGEIFCFLEVRHSNA